jgi:hypothetical protein
MKTTLEIADALDEAGYTLRRLSASGGFPAGYKSNWPETLRELGLIEMLDLKTEVRKSPPTARAISEFDKLHALIAQADLTPEERRLMWMRAGCIPGKRRSWKAIGHEFRCDKSTAWRRYVVILDQLAKIARKSVQSFSAQQNGRFAA